MHFHRMSLLFGESGNELIMERSLLEFHFALPLGVCGVKI